MSSLVAFAAEKSLAFVVARFVALVENTSIRLEVLGVHGQTIVHFEKKLVFGLVLVVAVVLAYTSYLLVA